MMKTICEETWEPRERLTVYYIDSISSSGLTGLKLEAERDYF
jgi:hypothetical protein